MFRNLNLEDNLKILDTAINSTRDAISYMYLTWAIMAVAFCSLRLWAETYIATVSRKWIGAGSVFVLLASTTWNRAIPKYTPFSPSSVD